MCRVGYNIISGENRAGLPQPDRPSNGHLTEPASSRVDRRVINQPFTFYH